MIEQNFNAIDYVSSHIPDNAFKHSMLVACQHLLPTVEVLLEALFQKGLLPEDVYLIGKCYSTNEVTVKNIRQMGVNVCVSSSLFDSYKPYEEDFKSHIQQFVKKIPIERKKYKNILVLDDGGDLHLAVQQIFGNITSHVSGVEQTTRGYAKLYKLNIKYPVINVARSQSKLEVESPMVAEAIVRGLNKYLEEIPCLVERVLLVGNGCIGNALAKSLNSKYDIIRYDLNPKLSDFHENQLKNVDLDVNMVLGCSGNNILPFLERNNILRKKVILASCSSTDVEFGHEKLRLQDRRFFYCHKTVEANGVYLLNGGFPVNFLGGSEYSIHPSKFQLTNSLLIFGLYQSIHEKEKSKGLIKLKEEVQKFICAQYFSRDLKTIVKNKDSYYPCLQ